MDDGFVIHAVCVSFLNHVNEDASLHDRVGPLAVQVLSNENLTLGEIIGSVERC